MERNPLALADQAFDLVVIGGGIFGICAAWEAVARGFSVALIEQADFAGQTSANSYKIVHGGIRYLQHADLVRLRRSCAQRSTLLRLAPHLVQPLPIVVPTFGHGLKGKAVLGAGMLLYDLLTIDCNRGIRDPERRIPWTRFLSAAEVRRIFPGLPSRDLTGAAVFNDAQMYNPPRLALSFLRAAVDAGAVAANYVQATGFLRTNDRIVGVRAEDRLSGERFEIRARAVLNAAGPWAEGLLRQALDLPLRRSCSYSRDVCFVLRERRAERYGLAVPGATRDPDALISRAARHLFIVPWRDYSLVGVWHAVRTPGPHATRVTADELQAFIAEINASYPALGLELDDVTLCCAGLVPFGENAPGAADLSYGKRSILIDHAVDHGVDGLVTLIGIRYTMAVGDAAKAIDLIAAKLARHAPRPSAEPPPVFGGRIEDFEALVRTAERQIGGALPARAVRALVHHYGDEYGRILNYAKSDQSLLQTVGTTTVVQAEITHAVREEMAVQLGDVVFRRTDLATGQPPNEADLATCARLMAAELGWSPARTEAEMAAVRHTLAEMMPHVAQRQETSPPLVAASGCGGPGASGMSPA
ncbi:MAG TPA: FAD-dependent oxidoreductase [Geminicoccaceae bacterium]|nr:FAD-dependent oxidoreductase [Geminicoccaceae bacterium]